MFQQWGKLGLRSPSSRKERLHPRDMGSRSLARVDYKVHPLPHSPIEVLDDQTAELHGKQVGNVRIDRTLITIL